jgi:hypothetical protein
MFSTLVIGEPDIAVLDELFLLGTKIFLGKQEKEWKNLWAMQK